MLIPNKLLNILAVVLVAYLFFHNIKESNIGNINRAATLELVKQAQEKSGKHETNWLEDKVLNYLERNIDAKDKQIVINRNSQAGSTTKLESELYTTPAITSAPHEQQEPKNPDISAGGELYKDSQAGNQEKIAQRGHNITLWYSADNAHGRIVTLKLEPELRMLNEYLVGEALYSSLLRQPEGKTIYLAHPDVAQQKQDNTQLSNANTGPASGDGVNYRHIKIVIVEITDAK